MVTNSGTPPAPNGTPAPWYIEHLEKIIAGVIAIVGLVAVIFGRDSYVVGVVGTSIGYLFGYGRGTMK